jgi:succinate dehydrogenase hydrophobic anchor subunit
MQRSVRDRTLWLVQIAAAGVVLGLLALHMATMHLDASLGVLNPADAPPVAWDNVVARGRGFGFLAGYVVLLGAALVHGLLGLRGILLELSPGPAARRAQAALLIGLGLGLFLLGTWAAWAAFGLAQGS